MNDFAAALRTAVDLILGFDAGLRDIVVLSLAVSLTASACAFVIGAPLGTALAVYRFRGRGALVVVVNALLGLPPVVVGLAVYLLLSRSGPLGSFGILFTPTAMVIAQCALGTPIVIALTHRMAVGLWAAYGDALLVDGAARWRAIVPLMRMGPEGLLTAFLAAFGRAIAEVGAIIIVGGNILGYTRTMTTAIVLETNKGNLSLALALGMILIVLSMAVSAVSLGLGRALALVRRFAARRKEQFLAVDLVGRDGVEAGLRGEPFVPGPRVVASHLRPLGGIDQNAAVRIEQRRIAFGQNFETLPVLEIGPGGAVGQRVGIHRGGDVQRRPHALAEVAIPGRALVGLDAGRLPQPKLHPIGAAVVAAAGEHGAGAGDLHERLARILQAANMRRIGIGPDNDEIVVHHVAAIDAKTVGDELVLADAIVDQERIGVAARADRKRLSGPDRDDVHAQAGRCAKDRQDVVEQAGVLGRGGRAENDEALVGLGGRYDQGRQKQGENSNHFGIPGTDRRQCNPGSGRGEIRPARLTFLLSIAAPARNTDRSRNGLRTWNGGKGMTGVQEAPTQTKPALAKIRTDVVGSLLRPEIVKEARIAFDDGKITADALHAIEDEAVREAVRLQEDAGLDVVTDGEMRRLNFPGQFWRVGGRL